MARKGLTKEDYAVAWQTLQREARPHRKKVALLSFLSVVVAGTDALVPAVAGRVFDAIITIAQTPEAALQTVFVLLAVWLLLKIISDTMSWRIALGSEELGTQVGHSYTAEGFGRLLEKPMSFHKRHKQGSLGEKINRAGQFFRNLIGNILVRVAPQLLTIVLVFIITYVIEPRLALILTVAVLLYVLILWRSVPGLAERHRRMNRAHTEAYGHAWELLGNVQEIKQVAAETYEQKKLRHKFVGHAQRLWMEVFRVWQKLSYAQRLLISVTQLSIFVAAVYLVRAGAITPGELVAFNAYAAMLFGPFVTLGNNWQLIQNGIVMLREAEKMLNSPTETYEQDGAVAVPKLNGGVMFKNVSFWYEKNRPVLSDVSFMVQPGQVVALVGESGVGKTTIVDLLLAFYVPRKGKILVDGNDIHNLNLRAYRKRVGIVPQETTLFNDTVAENIRYGSFSAKPKEIRDAAERAHAAEFIEKFPKKYKQRVGWRGIKLSTGQKQRIAIARAILQNPDILILDEPTSALDAQTEQYLQESLNELMKERTTFIIAHRLSTVRKADVILAIKEGRVAEQGTHDELMKIHNGIYKNLYELQIGLHE